MLRVSVRRFFNACLLCLTADASIVLSSFSNYCDYEFYCVHTRVVSLCTVHNALSDANQFYMQFKLAVFQQKLKENEMSNDKKTYFTRIVPYFFLSSFNFPFTFYLWCFFFRSVLSFVVFSHCFRSFIFIFPFLFRFARSKECNINLYGKM